MAAVKCLRCYPSEPPAASTARRTITLSLGIGDYRRTIQHQRRKDTFLHTRLPSLAQLNARHCMPCASQAEFAHWPPQACLLQQVYRPQGFRVLLLRLAPGPCCFFCFLTPPLSVGLFVSVAPAACFCLCCFRFLSAAAAVPGKMPCRQQARFAFT